MGLHFSFEEKTGSSFLDSSSGLRTIFIWSPAWAWLHKCLFHQWHTLWSIFRHREWIQVWNREMQTLPWPTCLPRSLLLEALLLPAPLAHRTTGLWESECPLGCGSWSRHSAFLRVSREEGTWTGMYEQPSLLRSLPFRFPKSWCARGLYNEEGFVCWRIFSALLLNSKVRRGWGQDENYSPLLCVAFSNSPNLSFVCSCPETAAKIILRTGSQKF